MNKSTIPPCKNKYVIADIPEDGKSINLYGNFVKVKLCYLKYQCKNCKYNPNKISDEV